MTKTAIVILNWNGLKFLQKFLGFVLEYSSVPDTKIYIADNNSDDGSVEWIEALHKNIEVIKLDYNYGYAEGYKRALQKIEATYYILLNSDIEVTPRWLDPLVKFMDQNPDVAACQPKIMSYSNKDTFEYAGAAGGFIDKYGYPFCRGRILNCFEKDTGQYDDNADIFWASGACIMVRSSAYLKCNGLDEAFFAHMEEIDLCWRFNRAGYRVSFVHDSVVFHVGGGTLTYNSQKKLYLNFRNNLYLLYKNLPDEKLHSTLFIRKILDGMSAIVFLFTGNLQGFIAIYKAHRDYYKEIPGLRKKRELLKTISSETTSDLIMNKSLIFEFYIRRKKSYTTLMQ